VDADKADAPVSEIAATIAVPARARMLYCLLDERARTSTELSVIAGVTPSTASVHLKRLEHHRLVKVLPRGRHRYYRLSGGDVAAALEALSVLAARSIDAFVPGAPDRLRAARTCYDHIAGSLGVGILRAFEERQWLAGPEEDGSYLLTADGHQGFEALGMDVEAALRARRRLAFSCLDWSERRPHLAGALGASVLELALREKWVRRDLDSRSLEITRRGRLEMPDRLGLSPL
jgi:DNA-binding transcriptional ArsR family regulator